MLDRIERYRRCLTEPDRWAVATVTAVTGSAPLDVGTSLALSRAGEVLGSVSGGCVDADVVAHAQQVLADGEAVQVRYSVADDALGVGLMCGGDVELLIEPMARLAEHVPGDGGALLRPLPGGKDLPPLPLPLPLPLPGADGAGGAERALRAWLATAGLVDVDVHDVLAALRHGTRTAMVRDRALPGCPVVLRVLVESPRPPARVLLYGANDFSAAVASAAAAAGRAVTVCDQRPAMSTAARHPGAHEVLVQWPQRHLRSQIDAGRVDASTTVLVLTHDSRVDLPTLDLALRSGAGFVGATGSRSTCARRAQELSHGGLPAELLARLHSPVGLDLGARTPAEVAISVLAEILAHEHGRLGPVAPLREVDGPVHGLREVAVTAWT